MNTEKTKISLEMLLLNDLLKEKVIDETIYNLAAKKIMAMEKEVASYAQATILATA